MVAAAWHTERAVSGGVDGSALCWDLQRSESIKILKARGGPIWSLSIDTPGILAISGSRDGCLRLWDLRLGRCTFEIEAHGASIWSIDVDYRRPGVLTGSGDYTAKTWDIRKGNQPTAVFKHGGTVTSVQVDFDVGQAVTGCSDRQIRLWDLKGTEPEGRLSEHKGAVWAARVDWEGKRAVSCASDYRILLWDLKQETPPKILPCSLQGPGGPQKTKISMKSSPPSASEKFVQHGPLIPPGFKPRGFQLQSTPAHEAEHVYQGNLDFRDDGHQVEEAATHRPGTATQLIDEAGPIAPDISDTSAGAAGSLAMSRVRHLVQKFDTVATARERSS